MPVSGETRAGRFFGFIFDTSLAESAATTRTGRSLPADSQALSVIPISSGSPASIRRAEVSEPFAVTPCRFLRHDPQSVARLTRADLLRRGVGGGVGLALLGGLPGRGMRLLESAAAATRPTVHGFVTRPDLRPPVIGVVTPARGTADGYLFLAPSSGPGMRGGLIADDRGDPVYFRPATPRTVMDFRAGTLRGAPVLSWWEGRYVFGVGKVGDYVIVDTSYREIARFSSARHRRPDFHEVLLTDDDTLLVTAYETRAADLTAVGGPSSGLVYGGVVQELSVPSGRLLWEWRSLDHVGITETVSDQLGSPFDYFHINGIEVDGDGNLLVSARNTSAMYKIARRTGKVIWRLGGKRSDFSMGKGTRFGFQHDARLHEGGRTISLFDNGPRAAGVQTGVEGDRARGRPATQAGDAEARHPAPAGRSSHLPPAATSCCRTRTGSSPGGSRAGSPSTTPTVMSASMPTCPERARTTASSGSPGSGNRACRPRSRPIGRAPELQGSTPAGTARPSSHPGGSKPAAGSGRFARAAPTRNEGSKRRSRSRRELVTRPRSRSTRRASRSGALGRFASTSRARRCRAGTGGSPSGPSRRPARCMCARAASARPPRRRAGRGPRRAGAGAAGRIQARSRRQRRAAPPTRPRTRDARPPRPGGCDRRRSAPRRRRRARRARGSDARPAACASATALRPAGGASPPCAGRRRRGRELRGRPLRAASSRTPPDWWRHGRTELMPTRQTAVRRRARAGRLPQPLELRPRLREPRRERVRDVVVARDGNDRERRARAGTRPPARAARAARDG